MQRVTQERPMIKYMAFAVSLKKYSMAVMKRRKDPRMVFHQMATTGSLRLAQESLFPMKLDMFKYEKI